MPRRALVDALNAVNSLEFVIEPLHGIPKSEMEEKLKTLKDQIRAASTARSESGSELVHVSRDKRGRWLNAIEELDQCTRAIDTEEAETVNNLFRQSRNSLTGQFSWSAPQAALNVGNSFQSF